MSDFEKQCNEEFPERKPDRDVRNWRERSSRTGNIETGKENSGNKAEYGRNIAGEMKEEIVPKISEQLPKQNVGKEEIDRSGEVGIKYRVVVGGGILGQK